MGKRRTLLALAMLTVAGCVGFEETRMLSWYGRHPDVERKSYDLHDPFPDERTGPDTYTRPRDFVEPRTDERRNAELRWLNAVRPGAVPVAPELQQPLLLPPASFAANGGSRGTLVSP